MSDDDFKMGGGEMNQGAGNQSSVIRYPTVTANLDTVFEILSNARRRYLLYYLFTMEGEVAEFDAAVNAVYKYGAAETGTDDHPTREDVKIELHHTHLPRLTDAGVIDYDRRQGTIRLTDSPTLEEWLEHARDKEID